MNEGSDGISFHSFFIVCMPDCNPVTVYGDAKGAATVTRTGEVILIGVSISVLLVALIISQTDWGRGAGNPGQLQHPVQVVLAGADGLVP